MVIDQLNNSILYECMNGNLAMAFEFIRRFQQNPLADGRYEIDGDAVYALVQSYDTVPSEQKKWESHRRYLDVQYMAVGQEAMLWAPVGTLLPKGEYIPEKDFQGYEDGSATPLRCTAGTFALFYPADIHKPGCKLEAVCSVKKIVVKIKL